MIYWQDYTQASGRASEAALHVRTHDQQEDWHVEGDYEHGDEHIKLPLNKHTKYEEVEIG